MNRRLARLILVALAFAFVAGACGSDDDKSDTASSTAPEDERATAAEVADGLPKIDGIVKDAAAAVGTDTTRAKDLSEQIEPVWEPIEGTIKQNDQDAYLTFEDSFAALEKAAEDGDQIKASKAASDVTAAVSAYLAKYPG